MLNGISGTNATNPFLTYAQRLRNTMQPSDLSFREREVLRQIKNVVGENVIVAGLEQIGGGFRGGFIGFSGASATGERQPFRVTPEILAEMAESEEKFQEWMSTFRENKLNQTQFEGWLKENLRNAEEEDAERKAHQARVRMMIKTDFWNTANENAVSTTQSLQEKISETHRAALGYEQMAVFQ